MLTVGNARRTPGPPFASRSAGGQIWGVLPMPGRALDRLRRGIERAEASAYPGRAQFGVEFGHGLDELLTGEFVAVGLAFDVSGEKVRACGHQVFVFLTRRGSLGDRFFLKVPAVAALGATRSPTPTTRPRQPTKHKTQVSTISVSFRPRHKTCCRICLYRIKAARSARRWPALPARSARASASGPARPAGLGRPHSAACTDRFTTWISGHHL